MKQKVDVKYPLGATVYWVYLEQFRNTCSACNGSNKITAKGLDNRVYEVKCPKCSGYGVEYTPKYIVKKCTVKESAVRFTEEGIVSYAYVQTDENSSWYKTAEMDNLFTTREEAQEKANELNIKKSTE